MLTSARVFTQQVTGTGDLKIRNLLDDPSLQVTLGLGDTARRSDTTRPVNIRLLLDAAAA